MNAVILNAGGRSWACEEHAEHTSQVLGVPVSDTPATFNFVLAWDGPLRELNSFIPIPALLTALDKRLIAYCFRKGGVPTPQTFLGIRPCDVYQFLETHQDRTWILRWPVTFGGVSPRFIRHGDTLPAEWPHWYMLQEFVPLERPEVYRIYGVGGELFGWNVRRLASEQRALPWVREPDEVTYANAGETPAEALTVAHVALKSTYLLDSFGCVDLLQDSHGQWLAIGVSTDCSLTRVDRNVPFGIAEEIDRRIEQAFHSWCHGQQMHGKTD